MCKADSLCACISLCLCLSTELFLVYLGTNRPFRFFSWFSRFGVRGLSLFFLTCCLSLSSCPSFAEWTRRKRPLAGGWALDLRGSHCISVSATWRPPSSRKDSFWARKCRPLMQTSLSYVEGHLEPFAQVPEAFSFGFDKGSQSSLPIF